MTKHGPKDLTAIHEELSDASAMVDATAGTLRYALEDLETLAADLDSEQREAITRVVSLLYVAQHSLQDNARRISDSAGQLHRRSHNRPA